MRRPLYGLALSRPMQRRSMMADVIADECGDEEIAVVIAVLQTQCERMAGFGTCELQQFLLQAVKHEYGGSFTAT